MFRPLPKYRISNAALGKRLATVIEMEKQAMMSPDQFHDTIFAVYNLILDPDFVPDAGSNHNPVIYEEQKIEVEKSARRSAAAREAARRRKEMKEAAKERLDHHCPSSTAPSQAHNLGDTRRNTDEEDAILRQQVRNCVRRQLYGYGW